jgi:hypothetical protein
MSDKWEALRAELGHLRLFSEVFQAADEAIAEKDKFHQRVLKVLDNNKAELIGNYEEEIERLQKLLMSKMNMLRVLESQLDKGWQPEFASYDTQSVKWVHRKISEINNEDDVAIKEVLKGERNE